VRKKKAWPAWPYVDDKVIDSVVKTTKGGSGADSVGQRTVPTLKKPMRSSWLEILCGYGLGTQHSHVRRSSRLSVATRLSLALHGSGHDQGIPAARALPVLRT